MDRLACVEVRQLPVQMLCRQEGWSALPVAWVDRDAANGTVLQANARACAEGVRAGMRYARALSLAPGLRAATLSEAVLGAQVAALLERLRAFSPEVEAATTPPGRFWLAGGGLRRVFGTPAKWARAIRAGMLEAGFEAAVVVGFERFATAALAGACQELLVLRDPAAEERALRRLPVAGVIAEAGTRETLRKLGVRSIGELEALPRAGRIERFGIGATLPERRTRFTPVETVEPLTAGYFFGDMPVSDYGVLALVVEQLLVEELLPRVRARSWLVESLHLALGLESRSTVDLAIEPAEPTLESRQLLRLVDLRLSATALDCGVLELGLRIEGAAPGSRQPSLFAVRDLDAANRALAELRARYGADAVVCAALRDEWLPGRDYAWTPLRRLAPPAPAMVQGHRLVRRLLATPRALGGGLREAPGPPGASLSPGWLPLRGVRRRFGPYHFGGGWWDGPFEQSHYFAECEDGELDWLAFDPGQGTWHLIGSVD